MDYMVKWKEGTCTCPCFLKKYMCKHVIGLSIRLKYVKPLPAAKQVPIGEKRKRGRPNKSSKALIEDVLGFAVTNARSPKPWFFSIFLLT